MTPSPRLLRSRSSECFGEVLPDWDFRASLDCMNSVAKEHTALSVAGDTWLDRTVRYTTVALNSRAIGSG